MTIVEFYDRYYVEAEKSKTHARFCEEVYGLDLCQHGMADTEQIDLMIRLSGIGADSSVLDMGCGVGRITSYIQKRTACAMTGLDISPKAIELAKSRPDGRDIEFCCADLATLDVGARYSHILMIDSHYFVDDFLGRIPEIMKSLDRDGKLVIFSDEGRGIEGADDSAVPPHLTLIGDFLQKSGRRFDGYNISAMNREHWRKKKEALARLEKDFILEGRQFLFENRMRECEDHDRALDGRFLFVIHA